MADRTQAGSDKLAAFYERVLSNTHPTAIKGRPGKETTSPVRGDRAAALRRQRGINEMRAIIFLGLCELRGYLPREACRLIEEKGVAELREIGRLHTAEAMLAAAQRVSAEIRDRQLQPRAGWDVFGTGGRRPPRTRIRDMVNTPNIQKHPP